MGLDQHAYAISKHDKALLETDEYRDGDLAIESEEKLMYWRKHANLNEWMARLYEADGGMQEFNCKRLWLSIDDIDALEKTVLADSLPHGEGFFWGQSSPEDKASDLEFIAKARDAFSRGLEVYYYCWW